MNKNTVIGSILIAIVFMAMMWFNQPSPEQIEAQRRYQDSIARLSQTEKVEDMAKVIADSAAAAAADTLSAAEKDSISNLRLTQKYGSMASFAKGEAQVITLQNNLVSVDINTKGGVVERAMLKEYTNYKKAELELFNKDNNSFSYVFQSINGKYLSTADFYFTPVIKNDTSVVLRLKMDDATMIDFVYTLAPDSYVVDYKINYKGMENIISPNNKTWTLQWNQNLERQELGRTFEERYSSLFYKYLDQSPDDLDSNSSDSESVSGKLAWVAFKNQFFSSVLITKGIFNAGNLNSTFIKEEQDPDVLKQYKAELEFDVETGKVVSIPMAFYFGPNSYPLLGDVDDQLAAQFDESGSELKLQKLVPLGWGIFGWVNKYLVIPVFNFLSKFISNYGIIILLLTIFIKLITLPFTYKSYLSTAKMRIVNRLPEAQAIAAKYPDQDQAMQKQQELMALYSRVGVSPAGVCIPMLFQWPVLLALFYFFPSSIELRGQSFLWAHDLSAYDSIISWNYNIPLLGNHLSLFCILMTVTNFLYTKLSMSQNAGQQSMPGMKFMMYIMPLMFFFILNDYAAGLSYYYFLSTLLGIIQTYAIRASLNEDKIYNQMEAALKKPLKKKKSSSWMEKLQKMQREQQRQLDEQRKRQQRRQ